MSKKVAQKLRVKVEYVNEEGIIIKEVKVHELNVKTISGIEDIGINDEDAQTITKNVEKELNQATNNITKINITGRCPKCGSNKYKKKTAKIPKNNNL